MTPPPTSPSPAIRCPSSTSAAATWRAAIRPVDYTVDGQSITVAPELLEGLTAQQIAESLGDTSNYQSKAILGDANYLTAALCELTGNQPGSVCGSSTITGLESKLG